MVTLFAGRHVQVCAATAVALAFTSAALGDGFQIKDRANIALINLPNVGSVIDGSAGNGAPVTFVPGVGAPAGIVGLQRNMPIGSGMDAIEDMGPLGASYYYRIGNSGNASAIESLGSGVVELRNNRRFFDQSDDFLRVTYGSGPIVLRVDYALTGSAVGSFQNNLSRTVFVKNTGASAVDFNLYSYNNLRMTGILPGPSYLTPDQNDQIELMAPKNGSLITQYDVDDVFGEISRAYANNTIPSSFQIGSAAALKDLLTNGLPSALSNSPLAVGPLGGVGDPGDLAWLLQYVVSVPNDGVFYAVSSEKLAITPEPASLLLLATGGLLIGARRRRRA